MGFGAGGLEVVWMFKGSTVRLGDLLWGSYRSRHTLGVQKTINT